MKIKQLLSLACKMLSKADVEEYLERGECADVVAALGEVKSLLVAYGNAMETASSCEPLVAEYVAEGGTVSISALPDKPTGIVGVTDAAGKAVDYSLGLDEIRISSCAGPVTVRYTFVPGERDIEDESDYRAHNKLTPRVLAYLICAEYLALKGCYSLAEEWYKRFSSGSAVCIKSLKGGRVKRRLWW